MKEAISNSMVMTIVIVIISFCIIVVLTSLIYSKTYKIKNRVVEIIEKHEEYNDGAVRDEIEETLREMGYQTASRTDVSCPRGRGGNAPGIPDNKQGNKAINTINNYKFCVYQYNTAKGVYYSVATFLTVDLPLISDILPMFRLEIPVYGETQVFYDF